MIHEGLSPLNPDLSKTISVQIIPPIQGLPGAISPEVKQPEREADHSPSFSVAHLHGVVLN